MKLNCGHKLTPSPIIKLGYGVTPEGHKICLGCCGRKQVLIANKIGATKLYLSSVVSPIHTAYHLSDYAKTFLVVARLRTRTRLSSGKIRSNISFDLDGFSWWGFRIHDEGKELGLYHCRKRRYSGRNRYTQNNVVYQFPMEVERETVIEESDMTPITVSSSRYIGMTFEEDRPNF